MGIDYLTAALISEELRDIKQQEVIGTVATIVKSQEASKELTQEVKCLREEIKEGKKVKYKRFKPKSRTSMYSRYK